MAKIVLQWMYPLRHALKNLTKLLFWIEKIKNLLNF